MELAREVTANESLTNPAPDDFFEFVEEEYKALVARIREQRERADRLRLLVERLEEQTSRDERALNEFEGLLGLAPQLQIEELDDRLRGQRLQEVAIEILRDERGPGEPVHYKEWYALLRSAGHHVGGKNPVATFLAQVARAPEIERVGRRSGLYLLKAA